MRQLVKRVVRFAGYDLRPTGRRAPTVRDAQSTVVSDMGLSLANIPGMMTVERCIYHYLLAYGQTILGDVVELGSWQGRNTTALAAGCRDSGNGVVHAIDHFKGNPGKREYYVVGEGDLSDLKDNFRANITRNGLDPWVRLHAANADSVDIDGPIRFLIIDGEHTYEACKRDTAHLAPLVPAGGLVLFDDYSPRFPGVVEAVQEWLTFVKHDTPVQLPNSLLVRTR